MIVTPDTIIIRADLICIILGIMEGRFTGDRRGEASESYRSGYRKGVLAIYPLDNRAGTGPIPWNDV